MAALGFFIGELGDKITFWMENADFDHRSLNKWNFRTNKNLQRKILHKKHALLFDIRKPLISTYNFHITLKTEHS